MFQSGDWVCIPMSLIRMIMLMIISIVVARFSLEAGVHPYDSTSLSLILLILLGKEHPYDCTPHSFIISISRCEVFLL